MLRHEQGKNGECGFSSGLWSDRYRMPAFPSGIKGFGLDATLLKKLTKVDEC